MNDTEIIKEMYRQYWKYMIAKNETGLRGMMSADYYLMHMTGARQSADEFISGLMGGTFNYYSADHDDIQVSIDGDTATMISFVSGAIRFSNPSILISSGKIPLVEEIRPFSTWYSPL